MHLEALFQCCRPVDLNVSRSWFVAQMTVHRLYEQASRLYTISAAVAVSQMIGAVKSF